MEKSIIQAIFVMLTKRTLNFINQNFIINIIDKIFFYNILIKRQNYNEALNWEIQKIISYFFMTMIYQIKILGFWKAQPLILGLRSMNIQETDQGCLQLGSKSPPSHIAKFQHFFQLWIFHNSCRTLRLYLQMSLLPPDQ